MLYFIGASAVQQEPRLSLSRCQSRRNQLKDGRIVAGRFRKELICRMYQFQLPWGQYNESSLGVAAAFIDIGLALDSVLS